MTLSRMPNLVMSSLKNPIMNSSLAGLRVGKRRAGGNGDHRCLAELPRIGEERLYP